jgi:RNA recognition motif-containing protein
MAAKVFVGNLDFKATRDQLETLFSEVGRPLDVFLPMDRVSGRPRGFAIVEFETEDQVQQVIARFNDHLLGGRPLRLSPAEDRVRPMRSFAGGGGGGGERFIVPSGRAGLPTKAKGSRRNLRARKRSL